MLNTNSYAAGVHQRLKRKSTQGVIRRPSDDQLGIYALLMHHALTCARQTQHGIFPVLFVGPHTNYNSAFCEVELVYLRTLGYDDAEMQNTLDALLADCAGDSGRLFHALQAVVYDFMPVWCANTGYQATGGARLPVYTYQEDNDDAGRYLVNEALGVDFATMTHILYPIPLREWLHGTWRRFDTFPRPYERARGVVERMR